MHIVISALHFDWDTLPHALEQAAAWGLAGIEFSWHPSMARPHCTAGDLAALASTPESALSLRTAHIWENLPMLDPSEARSALLDWLVHCQRTRTGQLVLHGGSYPNQREGLARLSQVLEGVLSAYEAGGVTLNLENHYSYTYHDGHELLSEPWEFKALPQSPALAFCYDTGHGNMTGNARELIAALGTRLGYVHLADNLGVDDDHLAYGEGTVPWLVIFDALQAAGFDGVMCVEFPVRADLAPFRACLGELRRRWAR